LWGERNCPVKTVAKGEYVDQWEGYLTIEKKGSSKKKGSDSDQGKKKNDWRRGKNGEFQEWGGKRVTK